MKRSFNESAQRAPAPVKSKAPAEAAVPPPATVALPATPVESVPRIDVPAPAAPIAAPRAEPLVLDALAADPPIRAMIERAREAAWPLGQLRQQLFPSVGVGPRAVLVVGAQAGDGATTVAAALAVATAQTVDDEAVLVDANFVRPGAARALGLGPAAAREGARGLADAASGAPLEEVLAPTTLPRLAVIGPGRAEADGFDALSTAAARRLFGALRGLGGRTIIDCAPVLERADALAAAPLVDSIVLVVRAGRTSERDARAALEALGSARPVAVLLNAVEAVA